VGGVALVVLGLGTWAGRWYAPLLRSLDGIHPSWLGPTLLCLGVGVVLTWQGEGHTAYPQTRCITNAVNRYLIDLTVPAQGTTCPAR